MQPVASAKASQRTDGSDADLPPGSTIGSARGSPQPYVPPLWSSRSPAEVEKLPEPFVFGECLLLTTLLAPYDLFLVTEPLARCGQSR